MSASDVRVTIDGTEYDSADLERNELERSRIALRVIKAAVGGRACAPLWPLTAPAWRPRSSSNSPPPGENGRAPPCPWKWMASRPWSSSPGGHPEHFVINPYHVQVDGHMEVIETLGQHGEPWRVFLSRVEIDGEAGTNPHPDFPIQPSGEHRVSIGGRTFTRDGSEIMQVLSVLRDTSTGMEVESTLRFPAQMPQALGEGQNWHFALEFMNWMTFAREALAEQVVLADQLGRDAI